MAQPLPTENSTPMQRYRVQMIRESIGKVTRTLVGKGIRVTQSGMDAYVLYDKKTGKPNRVNIPMLPDNADSELIDAIEGFIDHEVGHILFTDYEYVEFASKSKTAALFNVLEDTYVERMMEMEFAGSPRNLNRMRSIFTTLYIDPALEKLAKAKAEGADIGEREYWGALMSCSMRAYAGQPHFVDYMADKWHLIPKIDKLVRPFASKISQIISSHESAELALDIKKVLLGQKHPPSKETSEQESDDEGSDGQSDGVGNTQESDDPQPSMDDTWVDDEEKDREQGEGDDSDSSGTNGEDKDPTEEDEGGTEKESEPNKEGAESKDQAEEEGNDDEEGAGEGKDDHGEEGEGDESDQGRPEVGDQAAGDGDEDDEGDRESDDEGGGAPSSEEGDEETDSDANKDEEGESDLSEQKAGEESDVADEKQDEIEQPAEFQAPPEQVLDERDIENSEDFDDAMSQLVKKMTKDHMSHGDYMPFTNEWDYIGPYPVDELQKRDSSYDRIMNRAYDDINKEVSDMTGVLAKQLERAFVAANKARWEGGKKSGRISGAALSRLLANDPRVMRTREVTKTRDVAVTLLVDLSGSMSGGKIEVAIAAAWALGDTMQKLNLPCEIIGFTTGESSVFGNYEVTQEICEKMIEQYGSMYDATLQFSRIEPIVMPVFKSFDERFTVANKQALAHASATTWYMGSNVDGESLMKAASRLRQRPEPGKVMIVLSDGRPAAYGDTEQLESHLKQVVADLNSTGINTVGIGINTDCVKDYYPKHVHLNRISDLPSVVISQLREAILQKA